MSRKNKVTAQTVSSFIVYEQRMPHKKEDRYGDSYYEANFVKIGEVKATHAAAALDLAKTNAMARHPVIWGAETEGKRDKYKQRVRDDERPRSSKRDEE